LGLGKKREGTSWARKREERDRAAEDRSGLGPRVRGRKGKKRREGGRRQAGLLGSRDWDSVLGRWAHLDRGESNLMLLLSFIHDFLRFFQFLQMTKNIVKILIN